ncbi:MAG: hypothetical protein J6X18_08855 [Bacteroidales bacterium]|nr:hypothetical protein [Bacteroidales bacterium]
MKNVVRLSEQDFRKVVKETVTRVLKEDEDNLNLPSDMLKQRIPHDKTAFVPGDKVFYFRSASTSEKEGIGGKTGYFVGTITSVNSDTITFKEEKSGKEKTYNSSNKNIYYCLAWIGPLRTKFPNGIPSSGKFSVGYEKLDNGVLSVVITDIAAFGVKFTSKKYYYEYKVSYAPNEKATEIKPSETVQQETILSLAPGQNLPQTATKSAIQKFGRVVIKPEWCSIQKTGNSQIAVWNAQYFKEINTACPWLIYTDTWWKVPNSNEPKFMKARQKK